MFLNFTQCFLYKQQTLQVRDDSNNKVIISGNRVSLENSLEEISGKTEEREGSQGNEREQRTKDTERFKCIELNRG